MPFTDNYSYNDLLDYRYDCSCGRLMYPDMNPTLCKGEDDGNRTIRLYYHPDIVGVGLDYISGLAQSSGLRMQGTVTRHRTTRAGSAAVMTMAEMYIPQGCA
jgi:hypothetical protein